MGYRYEKYDKNDMCVILPSEMEGQPLTIIGTKAFLSCRQVEKLILPETLEQVEDWAFAHMKGLQEISFPAKEILFGKKVFLGCDALQKAVLTFDGNPVQGQYEGISYFLASVFRLSMDGIQQKLSNLRLAGDAEGQWQWLSRYDDALGVYLMRPDDYDFEPAFIGWFDVEDVDDQRIGYMAEQKKKKIALTLKRLLYSERISEETETKLSKYLVEKVPAQVLELMKDTDSEYAKDVKYFQIWQKIGGFKLYSPKFLLEQLEDGDPEVRSFLLECQLEEKSEEDFFENLEL